MNKIARKGVKFMHNLMDAKTLAYINMFGVLGTLENLCEIVPEAAEIIKDQKPISIGFDVKGGPAATLFLKTVNVVWNRVAVLVM